ncbi:30S ribosomal protein S4e [Candidatus Woesearchaeota archaeon]|nr:30S ribosomal protein S4e [Candidatus Woesearchaeota archaeon]
MAKKHLKRIAAPSTWMVDRKERKFIAMPKGSFKRAMGMPLVTVLKDVLRLVTTRKEGKRVLNSREILVNSKRRKDEKFMIGLMDVLAIKDIGKSYRMLLDRNNILRLVPVSESEASVKLGKVTGKRSVRKGRIQLSLHDGRSLLGEASHSTGDTVVIALPKGDVVQHLKLESGCQAYLIGGSNVGRTGVVGNISGDKVTIKIGDETVEAARRFVFVVGKDKPVVKSVVSV